MSKASFILIFIVLNGCHRQEKLKESDTKYFTVPCLKTANGLRCLNPPTGVEKETNRNLVIGRVKARVLPVIDKKSLRIVESTCTVEGNYTVYPNSKCVFWNNVIPVP